MKNYDPRKPSKFITYLDMNNLYVWAIVVYGDFKWLKNVDNFDVNSISENSSAGYVLEVDLKLPDELHVLHNDYPLAPEILTLQLYLSLGMKLKKIYRVLKFKQSD